MHGKTIIIGGVYEYTNALFPYALIRKYFADLGITLHWKTYKSGSAPLAKALANGDIDIAIILTDSVVRSIAAGAPISIISPYVLSPLDWVFHVAYGSKMTKPEDMNGETRFAISKFGSGGHLFALYWAHLNNLSLTNENFVEVGDMEGAVAALKEDNELVFLWERLTTLHYVDNKTLKEIHHIQTPFQPFCLAAANSTIADKRELLTSVLGVIHLTAVELKNRPDAVEIITSIYQRRDDEVEKSLAKLVWAETSFFTEGALEKVIQILLDTGPITKEITVQEIFVQF